MNLFSGRHQGKTKLLLFLVACIFVASINEEKVTFQISPLLYLPYISKSGTESYKGVGATYSQCSYMDGIGWYYNWGMALPDCGIENVSMIWDETFIGKKANGNSIWIMGFNEPDIESQANISPYQGAILWREIELVYQNKRLVSPSVIYLSWLDMWYNEYISLYNESPKIDAVGVHCYGTLRSDLSVLKCRSSIDSFVRWAKDKNISEVWVTEYAHLPCWEEGEKGSIKFINGMREYFNNEPMITRDAWFQLSYIGTEPWAFGSLCNTSLVDFYTGELTEIGKAYME